MSEIDVFEYRCAVLGAGFAGLSVAWHLLKVLSLALDLTVIVYSIELINTSC